MSNNIKVAKKGEYIFREGDKLSSVILIQNGSSNLSLTRPKKNIDLFTIGPSQILGEQAFLGANTHTFSLIATTETKFMEIPVDIAKAQVEAAPQFIKVLIKSLTDRLKSSLNEVKSSKLEKDSSPCPEDQTAKIFGSIYHAAKHKAKAEDEKNPKKLSLDWVQFKQYCQRIFAESPRRLEQATNLLVKLKMCSYTMGKPVDNPEGPDEIQQINFFDLDAIEAFFEFYQYYYFKGGASAILKFDESTFNIVTYFLKLAETLEIDRFGVVSIEYSKSVEFFKTEYNVNLNNGHFTQLEAKGVFAKRQARSSDGAVILSFEVKEWQTTHKIWRIIREIDKWNEKGFVDLTEEEEKPKRKPGVPTCPNCSVEVAAAAKFCQECGTKLEPVASAGTATKVA